MARSDTIEYAGFVRRVLAGLGDLLIVVNVIYVIQQLLGWPALDAFGPPPAPDAGAAPSDPLMVPALWAIVLVLGYVFGLSTLMRRSPGMLFAGVTILTADTLSAPGYGRTLGRTALGVITLFIGMVSILVSPKKQALHDKLSGTLVVMTSSVPTPSPSV